MTYEEALKVWENRKTGIEQSHVGNRLIGEVMKVTYEEALEVWKNRVNGAEEGRSTDKGGRAWLAGEFRLDELEALCLILRHEAGDSADGLEQGFKFNIGDSVALSMSGEEGIIIGRAEYETDSNRYYVRYVTGDGRQVEEWIGENAMVKKRTDWPLTPIPHA